MNPTQAKVQIAYYKTSVGLFVRNMWGYQYNGASSFSSYKFDGVIYSDTSLVAGRTFLPMIGVHSINKVERKKAASHVHIGYKIKDGVPEHIKAGLKPFYTVEESGLVIDDVGDRQFSPEFSMICGMYDAEYTVTPETWEELDVEFVLLGEYVVEDWQQPEKMAVKLYKENGWGCNGALADEVDLSTIVCYDDIEKILTPEFLMHKRPCVLKAAQVYKIIRAHIKENINPSSAEITSDYDFCFTVKRKIHHKPVTKSQEIKKNNGRSYATPKFKSTTVTYKTEELFEMAPKPYQNYTVVQDWKADSLEDMKEQIRLYLDMLMDEINKDVELCPCCNGVGSVVKKIPTNER